MAKMALIERELKRDKLVAKYAKKHAELKAIAGDAKRSDEDRMQARLALQNSPATPTRRASATVVRSRVVHAAPSNNSAWLAPRFAKWRLQGKSPASSKPAGKPQEYLI